MVLSNIGYMICESAITGFDKVNIISEHNGKAIGEGVLQTADELNRNGRWYGRSELFPALKHPRLLELMEAGYLRAELGHPLTTELVRQQTIDDSRTCAMFLKLWTQGNDIWAHFRGTNNEFGKVFDMDLKDGCKPAWSLRALGNVVKTNRGAEVQGIRIITWDQVIYPSHPGAYTRRLLETQPNYGENNDIVGEATVYPFNTDSVISYIQSESANLKYIKETFDFMYEDIVVNEDASRITLLNKDGDSMVVNIEKYISNEIMSYAGARVG